MVVLRRNVSILFAALMLTALIAEENSMEKGDGIYLPPEVGIIAAQVLRISICIRKFNLDG